MKNTMACLGIIALVAVIGFAVSAMFAACGNPADGTEDQEQPTATYTGTKSGKTYTLILSSRAGRAAVQAGGAYVLTVSQGEDEKTGAGTIKGVVDGGSGAIDSYELQSDVEGAPAFTVFIKDNGIYFIRGAITWDDGSTEAEPGSFAIVSVGNGGGGGYTGGGPTTHTHSYSTTWSSDATQHWHECTANDGAKTDVANHSGDPCTVCGYSSAPGTADNPFKVYDVTTLEKVGSNVDGWTLSAHYAQTADITLTAGSNNWTPIGNYDPGDSFTGSYDGGNHTISNLYIDSGESDYYQGMFGLVGAGGTVKNLTLDNVTITGQRVIGGVVGYNDGTVQNCHSSGNLSGETYHVGGVVGENAGTVEGCSSSATVSGEFQAGGVVGRNDGSASVLKNSSASGSVTSSSTWAGGVVGVNGGTVEGCSSSAVVSGVDIVGGVAGGSMVTGLIRNSDATGNVTATGVSGRGGWVGGVVGENAGTVEGCSSTGAVSGKFQVGGVVGRNEGSDSVVKNSSASGNVSGSENWVGGVAGINVGTVNDCYSTGSVSGEARFVGGVVGYNDEGTVKNCYSTGSISGEADNVGGVAGYTYGGSVVYNVALNSSVSGGVDDYRRVLGWNDEDVTGTFNNNSARGDLSPGYSSDTGTGQTGNDGTDVNLGTALSAVFSGWDGDIWDIPAGSLTVGGNLPTLKDIGGTQTPKLPAIGP